MTKAMTGSSETHELTLELQPGKAKAFARKVRAFSASGAQPPTETRAVYFDSEDEALMSAGVDLCLTAGDGQSVQAVEVAPGPARRLVWAGKAEGDSPDPRSLRGTPAEAGAKERKTMRRLLPRFEVSVTRQQMELLHDGVKVDLFIERGAIEAADARENFSEVRLSTDHGRPEPVLAIARELLEVGPLHVLPLRRSIRGHRLLAGVAGRPEKNIRVSLAPASTVAGGGTAILAACLDQLCINERLFRETSSPEALHQMRVAVRRLRAAVSLFGPVLSVAHADDTKTELRWISGLLGQARDLDVLFGKTVQRARERHPGLPGFDELASVIEGRRALAYVALFTAINSRRYFDLMLATVSLAETAVGAPSDTQADKNSLQRYVAAEFRRRLRSIRRKTRNLEELDPEARHAVRLRAKKLRYMLEFVAAAPWSVETRALAGALQELQDSLGSINDAVVGDELMADVAQDAAVQRDIPLALFAAGVVAGDAVADPAPLMQRALKAAALIRKDSSFR